MPDTGESNGLQEQSQRLQVWVYACATGACNCTLSTMRKGSIERQIIVAPDQWSERSIMSHSVAVCEWKTVVSPPYIGMRLVVLAHHKAAHSLWHTSTLATIAYKGRDTILSSDLMLNTKPLPQTITTTTTTLLIEEDDTQLRTSYRATAQNTTHLTHIDTHVIQKIHHNYYSSKDDCGKGHVQSIICIRMYVCMRQTNFHREMNKLLSTKVYLTLELLTHWWC